MNDARSTTIRVTKTGAPRATAESDALFGTLDLAHAECRGGPMEAAGEQSEPIRFRCLSCGFVSAPFDRPTVRFMLRQLIGTGQDVTVWERASGSFLRLVPNDEPEDRAGADSGSNRHVN